MKRFNQISPSVKAGLLTASLLLMHLQSCKKDEIKDVNCSTLDCVLSLTGSTDNPIVSRDTADTGVLVDIIQDGQIYQCEKRTVTANDFIGGGDSSFPLFDPNASVIWPGNLLQYQSINDATPKNINVARGGGRITLAGATVKPGELAYEDFLETNLGEVNTAKSKLSNNVDQSGLPAKFNFSFEQILSSKHLAFSLGVGVDAKFAQIEAALNYNQSSEYNSMLVKLDQGFYTLVYEPQGNDVEDFFGPDFKPDDLLEKGVGPGNPPVYISSVTYGRIFYMLVETTSSSSELEARVEAAFHGGQVNASLSSLDSLHNKKIKVFAFGGSLATFQAIYTDNLSELVSALGESSTPTTGLPVSYVVSDIATRLPVKMSLATSYDILDCKLSGSGYPARFEHWKNVSGLLGGPVGAVVNIGPKGERKIAFFNRPGDQYVLSENDQLSGPYPIQQLGNNPMPFPVIGAGLRYFENTTYRGTYFFDALGINVVRLLNGTFETPSSTEQWAAGGGPFKSDGIGAGMQYVGGGSTKGFIVFDRDGDRWTIYDTVTDSWHVAKNTKDIFNGQIPFDNVSAATMLFVSNTAHYVMVDDTGTKFAIYVAGQGFSQPLSF